MTTISATVLPSGPQVEPEPMLIEPTHTEIQKVVGGHFDMVRVEVENEEGDTCIVLGYVHDEGLIRNMEPNYLATALFRQELRGPCLLMSGLSPEGEYDGECYDLPSWVWEGLSTDLVQRTASTYNKSKLLQFGLACAVEERFCTAEELKELMKAIMAQSDFNNDTMMSEEQHELVDILIDWARVELYRTNKLVDDDDFVNAVIDAVFEYEQENNKGE